MPIYTGKCSIFGEQGERLSLVVEFAHFSGRKRLLLRNLKNQWKAPGGSGGSRSKAATARIGEAQEVWRE